MNDCPGIFAEKLDKSGGKMKRYRTVIDVWRTGLCMGCGICRVGCPVDAIRVIKDPVRGLFRPEVNARRCTDCRNCLKICPGLGFDFTQYSRGIYAEDTNHQSSQSKCYIGYALDEEIRYSSSSGGVVTAMLIEALENKLIDGAVVTRFSDDDPLETEAFVAASPEEIISAAGSKYCPVHLGDALNEIKHKNGRFAVVGLSCHIQGIRKLQNNEKLWRDRIVFCLGLNCLNNNSFNGTLYYLRANGINFRDVRSFSYRGMGWPGKMVVSLRDGRSKVFNRGPNEPLLSRRLLLKSAFHNDFMIPRCLTCPDLKNETADISVQDPWHIKELLRTDSQGQSFMVIRTVAGSDFLSGVMPRGKISIREVSPPPAQEVEFKFAVWTRILIRKKLGLSYPIFLGKKPQYTRRGLAMSVFYIGPFLTRYRWFWRILPVVRWMRYILSKLLDAVS